ncbi:expressed unknown protein [Ectocarpus siliculosus]|uniref:Uncharacterized protein n=1 Tax=Ectocarpus siliculosus TaxID=2880 RepID=D7FU32_ECTSI|nr:expressed unknown protein [Ectocarpus siliculosus]|eukprot:CBJ31559.1 expressed unknown protein [Ectocarpus siliculosus]
MVSAGASTAACPAAGTAAAATAAAAAAGWTEGISMHSDDGGAGRYRRVVTRRSSDTARPAVDLGQKEQAWKRSERTHLLGRVELQREKAAARGVGRLQAGRGRGLASAGSVKSRSDSGSSCPDSSAVAGPTAAPRGFPAESEDGRRGGGGCRDDSEYGGGGNAVTVSPSRRCCVEGRLEVMERNVTAVLRRLDELEKRKSKGGNDDRSVHSTRSDRHVHAV